VVTIERDGKANFRCFNPDASSIEILGSFTGWRDRPIRMTKTTDGWWHADVELASGDHEFQYLVNSQEWLADYAAGGLRMNKFGSWVSLLSVPTELAVRFGSSDLRIAA